MMYCSWTCTLKTFLRCVICTIELVYCSGSLRTWSKSFNFNIHTLCEIETLDLPTFPGCSGTDKLGCGSFTSRSSRVIARFHWLRKKSRPLFSREGLYSTLHTYAGFWSGCRGNQSFQGASSRSREQAQSNDMQRMWRSVWKRQVP